MALRAGWKRYGLGALLMISAAGTASAQQIQAPPGMKDCQTIRTCNFARGAQVRGCLSSYSCRSCRFVAAGTRILDGRRVQNQVIRCGWGAPPDS